MLNYYKDRDGIIHQLNREKFIYDSQYVSAYDAFKKKTREMAYLRLGYLISAIGKIPKSIFDYGYGNGSFLEVCQESGIESFGTDISNYPIPSNCTFINPEEIKNHSFDVLCFFDCLEHIEDLSFLGDIQANYIYISLPWCHQESLGDKWFDEWKHKKPNEHLHHFSENALKNYMSRYGYDCISVGNPEDCIRKSNHTYQNILTGVFIKKNE